MKKQTHDLDKIHRDLLESWKLWLSWFMWFYGINFLCIGWFLANTSPYILVIAFLLTVYHFGGIIASFGIAFHTFRILKINPKNKIFGFPFKLAIVVAMLSGINLIVQMCFWLSYFFN